MFIVIICCRSGGWFDWLPAWRPTSEKQLVDAEKAILAGKRVILEINGWKQNISVI